MVSSIKIVAESICKKMGRKIKTLKLLRWGRRRRRWEFNIKMDL